MPDILSFVILTICLLFFLWFFLKPKSAREVHYFIHKNKQQVLDISKAHDLYTNPDHVVIAHLSDSHLGKKRRVKKINPLIRSTLLRRPDVIVHTGDLIANYDQWPHRQTGLLVDKLQRFTAPLGKLAVLGNQDYSASGQYFVKEVLKEGDFTPLINEEAFAVREDVSLRFIGFDDTLVGNPQYTYEKKIATWHVLLVHEAHHIEEVPNLKDYDLVLTGHETPANKRKEHASTSKFTHGLYQLGKNTLLSIHPGFSKRRFLSKKPVILYYHLANSDPKKDTP
ncbi:metallophosphoesterase [Enterococcus sp. LJL98]